jgi:hypothetical protein
MKRLALAAAIAVLAPSLAWAHGGGLDQYGCHTDAKKGDYHCHQGKLKGRSFKSQDTMLAAHPDMRAEADKAEKPEKPGERAKKAKAEDKVKDGDKTTTDEYAKDAKSKASSTR